MFLVLTLVSVCNTKTSLIRMQKDGARNQAKNWMQHLNGCLNIWAGVLKMQHNTSRWCFTHNSALLILELQLLPDSKTPKFLRTLGYCSLKHPLFILFAVKQWLNLLFPELGSTRRTIQVIQAQRALHWLLKGVFILRSGHKLMCCCDVLVSTCLSTLDLWLQAVGKKERKCVLSAPRWENVTMNGEPSGVCARGPRARKRNGVCALTRQGRADSVCACTCTAYVRACSPAGAHM